MAIHFEPGELIDEVDLKRRIYGILKDYTRGEPMERKYFEGKQRYEQAKLSRFATVFLKAHPQKK